MSSTMNRDAYARLVAEDVAWLEQQPRTLEREHVLQILRESADVTYPTTQTTCACPWHSPHLAGCIWAYPDYDDRPLPSREDTARVFVEAMRHHASVLAGEKRVCVDGKLVEPPASLTAEELATIEARANALPAPPWRINHDGFAISSLAALDEVALASFVVHARMDVPRLVAILRAQTDEIARCELVRQEDAERVSNLELQLDVLSEQDTEIRGVVHAGEGEITAVAVRRALDAEDVRVNRALIGQMHAERDACAIVAEEYASELDTANEDSMAKAALEIAERIRGR